MKPHYGHGQLFTLTSSALKAESIAYECQQLFMPPAWWAMRDECSGTLYYLDARTEVSVWDPLKPYVHRQRKSRVNGQGGYLELPATLDRPGVSLYEKDESWQRFGDSQGHLLAFICCYRHKAAWSRSLVLRRKCCFRLIPGQA